MPQTKLQKYFDAYYEFHKTKGNQVTHFIGIPLILFSTLGLFAAIPFSWSGWMAWIRLDAGSILWFLSVSWYMSLDWKITPPFALFALGNYYLALKVPLTAHIVTFLIGWVIQLFGHYYFEKKKPAFAQNIEHLLIGPLWIFSKTIGYIDLNKKN